MPTFDNFLTRIAGIRSAPLYIFLTTTVAVFAAFAATFWLEVTLPNLVWAHIVLVSTGMVFYAFYVGYAVYLYYFKYRNSDIHYLSPRLVHMREKYPRWLFILLADRVNLLASAITVALIVMHQHVSPLEAWYYPLILVILVTSKVLIGRCLWKLYTPYA